MHVVRRSVLLSAAVAMGICAAHPIWADCGSIPFYSPKTPYWKILGDALGDAGRTLRDSASRRGTKIDYDPRAVEVFEPGQRAIILWNGHEQILALSTDLRASQATSLLEVIPVPAEPQVRLGDIRTFKKVETLFLKKQTWAVASGRGADAGGTPYHAAEITFHERMGVHDISVVKVLSEDDFIHWVNGFLANQQAVNPQVSPEFRRIIQSYLDRGCRWFVFDTVHVGSDTLSREPVIYRFRTDKVYYPLEISSLEKGKTKVDLLVMTKDRLSQYPDLRPALRQGETVTISEGELGQISEDWAAFMNTANLSMQRLAIEGDMADMRVDLLAQ